MSTSTKLQPPADGEKIQILNGQLKVPDRPIIPFIEGDGIGRDIWRATKLVLDEAVKKAYQGRRQIVWFEVYACEKAQKVCGELLPQETLDAIREFAVAIKGPLTTPIGSGYRSVNVALRQLLNLYACVRHVKYIPGVPSPLKHPDRVDIVIFRENTEDVYAGIEWESETPEAKKLISYLNRTFKSKIDAQAGVGVKPISPTAAKRLARKAIKYAIEHGCKKVTLVHKGNIMKYTEGAFRKWGYEVAKEEFGNVTITEEELWSKYNGQLPPGKILVNDIIADIALANMVTRPWDYDVIAAPNLNGDYLSEVAAALVGGVGVAPGANLGDAIGLFEAIHGSAPKHADKDEANPTALILSGAMMLDYLGWKEAARLIRSAIEKTIQQKRVTYDLARQMEGATKLPTSKFGQAVVENMPTHS